MSVIQPKEFIYQPWPTDEWVYAVVDAKPTTAASKFDETKDTLTVLFRAEQDLEFTYTEKKTDEDGNVTEREVTKNVRGQKIPRMFPVNWPNDKSKREPLLFQFASVVVPEHAIKNRPFDTDVLEGKPCFIMVEDQKLDGGGTFQKVVKWKAAKAAPKKAATPKAVPVAVTAVDEDTVDY